MKTILTTMKKTGMRFKGFMFLYMLLATVTAVGLIIINRLTGEISEAAVTGDTDIMLRLLIFVTGVTVLRVAAAAINTVLLAKVSANAGYKLRAHFIDYFLRVPFATLEKSGSGESLSIFSNDIPVAERLITGGLVTVFEDFISFISAFVFLILISPSFTGILFLAAVGMLVMQLVLSIPLQKMTKKMSERKADFNAVVNDSLQNLSTVAAYSLEDVLEERYLKSYNKYFALTKRFAWFLGVMVGSMLVVIFSPLIVMFIVLANGVISGNLTLAEFVAFITTVIIAATNITQLAQNISNIAQLIAGGKRLNENTAEALEEEAAEDIKPVTIANTSIIFENVSFFYGDNKDTTPALDNISLEINPGDKIAIVGGSGSGKSTMLKLLLGLYEPTAGEIKINDKNATNFTKSCLRNIFAYVPQDSFLFPEGIAQNISLEPEISDMPRLQKACAGAGILDFINTLPDKFSSVLSEAAGNISGGQRQRIAMARAFYKDAPVILFDEATSALDPATEAAILTSLDSITPGKTVIMVAHRPKAIAACDTIIVMDKGKIVGIGTNEELLNTNEIYRGLYFNENSHAETEVA